MIRNPELQRILDKLKALFFMLSNKERAILVALLVIAMMVPLLWAFQSIKQKEVDELRIKRQEFELLSEEYRNIKRVTDSFEKRGELTQSRALLEESHGLFESLGIKKKIKSIKGLGSREVKDGYLEESVQIGAENLTVNEIVNLFNRIDRAPMMLSVKSFSIKRSFEDPEHMHLNLNLALYVKK